MPILSDFKGKDCGFIRRCCAQDAIYIKSLNNLGLVYNVWHVALEFQVSSQCFLSFHYIGCKSFAVNLHFGSRTEGISGILNSSMWV